MRVTASSFPAVLSHQLTRLSTQQARLQTQAGTGQRFTIGSEDPRAMRKVLDLQTEIKSLVQYERNIGTLTDTISASYVAMSGIKKVSDRGAEIATRADGLRTSEELRTFAAEIDQLLERGIQLANSRHQSSYLFAGTKNTTPPFSATRDANGRITAVTYQGAATVSESEISEGIKISVTAPGANTTGSGARGLFTDNRAGVGADLFGHLITLRNNLEAGNRAAITATDLPNLLKDEDNILYHYGNVGAVQTRLETANALSIRRRGSLEGLVSDEADADLAQTLVELSEIQNAYTAALKTGGTILGQSLLDYLR
jgi:flagellar hook-associated protein 3 FlgL